MKKIAVVLAAIAAACALLFAGGWLAREGAKAETAAALDQWEYLIVAGGNANLSADNERYPRLRKQPDGPFSRESFPLERNLDKLGAEGWELVAVMGSVQDPTFYLKRPRNAPR